MKKFEDAALELIEFDKLDVIATSQGDGVLPPEEIYESIS